MKAIVLHIGGWSSSCGNCKNSNVDPFADAHIKNYGYNPEAMPEPCGETFTHVTSDYILMDNSNVKSMRPDLIWID